MTELESEAELAAVLGHEAVHAAARHSAKQQSRAMIMQVGVLGTAVAASDSDYGGLIAGGASVLAQMGLAKYGRSAELESTAWSTCRKRATTRKAPSSCRRPSCGSARDASPTG